MKHLLSMWRQLPHIGTRWAGALALSATVALGVSTPAQAQTPHQTITSSGPLQQIFLGNELSAQISHVSDPSYYQVFPSGTVPGDYGTFAVIDGTLYAPDFRNHGGTATGGLGTYTAFTPVSQTAPTGAGTLADPMRVVTAVAAGSTGITITQTDSYVQGQDTYRTDITLTNGGTAPKSIIAYRAMDCYLGSSDTGYGWATGANISCAKNANNTPPGRVLSLMPISGGSQYAYDGYSAIWKHIETQQPFANTCNDCAVRRDNGIGISWSVTVPAGGSVTLSHLTLFSPTGTQPLMTAKAVTPSATTPGGTVNYTITVTNPNTGTVTLDTLVDTLPAGFSYVAGSTTGATNADPATAGQALTWSGPLQVPGNGGTLTLGFTASVAASVAPGTYYNRVQGSSTGFTVLDSGDTAPVTVAAAAVQPLSTTQTVTPGSSSPGGQVTYTITVANPNASAVTLDTLVNTLPDGFSYVSGTTSGATTSDPTVAGQTLTWSTLAVPANGTLTLRFVATIGPNVAPGTYPSNVQATATGYPVSGATATAPVTVVAAPTPPTGSDVTAVPVFSPWALLALLGLLGFAGRRSRKLH